MKDRLLARLHNKKGFTLIELLVVIAIIAILVVIVVVAINPVQRLNDANDRTAESNVRSTGTLIGVCITNALVANGDLADCENNTEVASLGEGNIPNGVTVNNAGITNVCAWQELSTSSTYAHYQSKTGEVESPRSTNACPA